MTTLPLVAPHGAALPRVSCLPPRVSSAGAEAVDLAESAGIRLDDWQRYVLECGLAERANGRWAAFEVALIVPRQNGKTHILMAVELAGLFLFGEELILHSAHQFKAAKESFRMLLQVIDGCDFLRSRVKRVSNTNGEEGIELVTGQRARFIARSQASGRGFSGDKVIMDEAYNLSDDALAALLPTLSARPNPQLWYASSAGQPDSFQLQHIRERGLAHSPGLAYLEWSAPDDADHADVNAWAQANPALGIRISAEHVANERGSFSEAAFARERLGIWEDSRTAAVIPADLWAGLADRKSVMLDPVAFAIDVSVDRKRASVAAAGRRMDGIIHVEVIDNREGTAWIPERLAQLTRDHGHTAVVVDQVGAAAALLPELTKQGIACTVTNTRDYANACARFYDAVHHGTIRHLDSPVLNLSVNQARQRVMGDAWAWQRRDLDTDITPLVAVTLALHGLGIPPPHKRSGKVW